MIRMRLGNTSRDRSHTQFRDQFNRNSCFRIDVL